MTKKSETPSDPFFVIGFDKGRKPRGARFAEITDLAFEAAAKSGLDLVHPASAAFVEAAKKLPKGRVYTSGKAFIPGIRLELANKLLELLETDGSQVHRPDRSWVDRANSDSNQVACISPTIPGLPRSWESVGIGHMVLVHESPADGWWEAVVIDREAEVLTLRFRDYPKLPAFVRHISAIALVNPGPANPS
jgi:hypothetical protein